MSSSPPPSNPPILQSTSSESVTSTTSSSSTHDGPSSFSSFGISISPHWNWLVNLINLKRTTSEASSSFTDQDDAKLLPTPSISRSVSSVLVPPPSSPSRQSSALDVFPTLRPKRQDSLTQTARMLAVNSNQITTGNQNNVNSDANDNDNDDDGSSSDEESSSPSPSTAPLLVSTSSSSSTSSLKFLPPTCCIVCGDDISVVDSLLSSPSSLETFRPSYFLCPNDLSSLSHVQCPPCFAAYVKHCSESYLTDSLPIKCSDLKCKTLIPEYQIKYLLEYSGDITVLPFYERCCILSGLLDNCEDNIPITCFKCNKYTALYPKNYKERAARLKILEMREVKEEKEGVMAYNAQVMMKMMDKEMKEEKSKGNSTEGKEKKDEKEGKSEPKSTSPTTPSPPLTDLAIAPPPPLQRQASEGILTSLFFDCQTQDCHSFICLRCDAQLPSIIDRDTHVCNSLRTKELYDELISVLAMGSVVPCPQCGEFSQKDQYCCHMSCKCGGTYCYSCGKSTSEFGGNFSTHNLWTVTTLPSSGTCPMYLQYKYSTLLPDATLRYPHSSDPWIALRCHHAVIQKRMFNEWMNKYKETGVAQDVALIEEMISTKFPHGIWEQSIVNVIEESEAVMAIYQSGLPLSAAAELVKTVKLAIAASGDRSKLRRFLTLGVGDDEKKDILAEYKKRVEEAAVEAERIRLVREAERERRRQEAEELREMRTQNRILRNEYRRQDLERKAQERKQMEDAEEKRREDERRREEEAKEAERKEREDRAAQERMISETAELQLVTFRKLRAAAMAKKNLLVLGENEGKSERRKQRRLVERQRAEAARSLLPHANGNHSTSSALGGSTSSSTSSSTQYESKDEKDEKKK